MTRFLQRYGTISRLPAGVVQLSGAAKNAGSLSGHLGVVTAAVSGCSHATLQGALRAEIASGFRPLPQPRRLLQAFVIANISPNLCRNGASKLRRLFRVVARAGQRRNIPTAAPSQPPEQRFRPCVFFTCPWVALLAAHFFRQRLMASVTSHGSRQARPR